MTQSSICTSVPGRRACLWPLSAVCVLIFTACYSTVDSGQAIGSGGVADPRQISVRSQIEGVIRWIPADFEALTVVREPYWISENPPGIESPARLPRMVCERVLERVLTPPKGSLPRGTRYWAFKNRLRQLLAGRTVELCVEASGHHQMSEDRSGGVIADRVDILVFRDRAAGFPEDFYKALEQNKAVLHRTPKFTLAELPLHRPHHVAHDGSIWLTMPEPHILIIASRREFLINACQNSAADREAPFPETLPEWSHISPSARAWGLRHYRNPPLEISDVRVLSRNSAELKDGLTGQATGFAFSMNSEDRQARVTWLQADERVTRFVSGWFRSQTEDAIIAITNSRDAFSISLTWAANDAGLQAEHLTAVCICWFQGFAGLI